MLVEGRCPGGIDMRRYLILSVLGCCWLPLGAVAAAGPPSGKPSIRIVSPANNTVIRGSTISVRVAVSHFKLVPPVLVGPNHWQQIPLLKGNQGHIHYLLDGTANLVLTRDVVVRLTHTWTNVSPGPHTITAYLANSQHAAFPGADPAIIHVMVKPAQTRQARTSPEPTQSNTPSITITEHRVERTNGGARLLIRVHVAHFKLVAPVFKNPPLLPMNEGHIHYALDSVSNFIATKNASAALSHPWLNVSPGRHKVIAYLATSQHQMVPGTRPAVVTIDVPRGAGPQGRTVLYIGKLPGTGGGGDAVPGDRGQILFIPYVVACLVLTASLLLVRRRVASR